ncbi:MAG TPA: prolyl oligopeptidase family serine peptidase, partial [Chloroflexota bacterium]
MRTGLLLATAGLLAVDLPAQGRVQRPMTFDDFSAVRNVGDPQVSPDGRWVLYSVRTTDVGANRRTTVTVLAPVEGASAGSRASQFPNASTSASEARWSPDGKRVAYTVGGQLWIADVSGANARQISNVSGGVSGPVWAPSGDRIAFVSGVYPDCDSDACNIARAKAADTGKVKAHIADNLLYRHWTEWTPATRSHLFVVSPDGTGLRDVTAGVKYDVPPGPFSGSEAYSFSPDGKELAYTAKDQGREDAWSTDNNVYTVPVAGGAPVVITAANRGGDQNPVYSPDGRTILYGSQARPGFESDRVRLMAYDRASRTSRELLPSWDRNADSYAFSPSGDAIYLNTVDASRMKLYRISRSASGWSSTPQLLTSGGNNFSPSVSSNGRTIVWLQDATERPAEVYAGTIAAGGLTGVRRLTHENDALLAHLKLNPVEDFWFKGADGDSVQGMLVKPPQYEPGKKFPVLFLIHGGPQGEWLDQWHGRWSFELFASPGFGIVAINPRGSFGYGQKFTDQISKDWGGKVYTDLMNGLDAALARNSWLDSTRMGAAGGSYGGY